MASTAYTLGRFLGRHPVAILITGCAIFAYIFWSSGGNSSSETAVAASPPRKVETESEKCKKEAPERLLAYQKELTNGMPWQAANQLRRCANLLKDARLQGLVDTAEQAERVKVIKNKNFNTLGRLQAIEQMEQVLPAEAKEFSALKSSLKQELEKTEASERRAAAKLKRSQGVTIGMSRDDVRASSWGKPERINTTTNAWGEREQWVYGGSNYLYFDDGVLSSIQTGN